MHGVGEKVWKWRSAFLKIEFCNEIPTRNEIPTQNESRPEMKKSRREKIEKPLTLRINSFN
jgi:hypothetical protein